MSFLIASCHCSSHKRQLQKHDDQNLLIYSHQVIEHAGCPNRFCFFLIAPVLMDFICLCSEFSEQLEDVTRSIREGWARTWSPRDLGSNETPDANGSPHGSAASGTASGDITGTMALMEQLIEDIHMDQEELRCLLAQDVGTTPFVSLTLCFRVHGQKFVITCLTSCVNTEVINR